MAIVDPKSSALPVPYAMEVPDRVPKERYYDPDFYALEAEQLWSRIWQMACRLEEIPQPHDFVEYEILDQSVVVLRTEDMGGRRVPERLPPPGREGRRRSGDVRERVHLPVPRLVLRRRRHQHRGHPAAVVRRAQPRRRRARSRAGAVRDVGRLRVGQPRPRGAAAAECLEPFATILDAWKVGVAAHRVVVRAPAPRELEARRSRPSSRCTTWCRRTRSSSSPTRYRPARRRDVRPARLRRRRHPVPARDERGHGRDGARERRARGREPARHRAARRREAGHGARGTARSTTRS